MEVPVMNTSGQQTQTVDLPEAIFGIAEPNVGLMHQAYLRQMANARQGTHSTLKRGEVRLTKAKAYRQKGTGRARHGARSAPIFVGGGVAHGPRPRKYTKKMPKKMRRSAIRNALSALLRDDQLIFVDRIALETPKTKEMAGIIQAVTGGSNALLLVTREEDAIKRSVNNLPKAQALLVNYLNIRDLLRYDKVIVPLDALDVINEIWGEKEHA